MRLPSHGGKVSSLGSQRGLGYKCHGCVFAPAKVACAMRDGSIVFFVQGFVWVEGECLWAGALGAAALCCWWQLLLAAVVSSCSTRAGPRGRQLCWRPCSACFRVMLE